jgi:hypothetical protein
MGTCRPTWCNEPISLLYLSRPSDLSPPPHVITSWIDDLNPARVDRIIRRSQATNLLVAEVIERMEPLLDLEQQVKRGAALPLCLPLTQPASTRGLLLACLSVHLTNASGSTAPDMHVRFLPPLQGLQGDQALAVRLLKEALEGEEGGGHSRVMGVLLAGGCRPGCCSQAHKRNRKHPLLSTLLPTNCLLPSHAAAPSNVSAAVLRALTSGRFRSAAASIQQRGYGRGGAHCQASSGVSGLWGSVWLCLRCAFG